MLAVSDERLDIDDLAGFKQLAFAEFGRVVEADLLTLGHVPARLAPAEDGWTRFVGPFAFAAAREIGDSTGDTDRRVGTRVGDARCTLIGALTTATVRLEAIFLGDSCSAPIARRRLARTSSKIAADTGEAFAGEDVAVDTFLCDVVDRLTAAILAAGAFAADGFGADFLFPGTSVLAAFAAGGWVGGALAGGDTAATAFVAGDSTDCLPTEAGGEFERRSDLRW